VRELTPQDPPAARGGEKVTAEFATIGPLCTAINTTETVSDEVSAEAGSC
jgi:hypothetical protein